jgi:hypothetical protein
MLGPNPNRAVGGRWIDEQDVDPAAFTPLMGILLHDSVGVRMFRGQHDDPRLGADVPRLADSRAGRIWRVGHEGHLLPCVAIQQLRAQFP